MATAAGWNRLAAAVAVGRDRLAAAAAAAAALAESPADSFADIEAAVFVAAGIEGVAGCASPAVAGSMTSPQ